MANPVEAWESLFRAQVAVMRRLVADFPPGLSFNEYDVLFNLSRTPDGRCRLRDLTQQVLLSQPSISRLVDRLVARGYLEKAPDENDRRGTFVILTEAGSAAYKQGAIEHARSIRAHVGNAHDEDEMAQLQRLTEKLRRANQSAH